MAIKQGELKIQIKSTSHAGEFANWYLDKLGYKYGVCMYDIVEDLYTVHPINDRFRQIPGSDVEVIE